MIISFYFSAELSERGDSRMKLTENEFGDSERNTPAFHTFEIKPELLQN